LLVVLDAKELESGLPTASAEATREAVATLKCPENKMEFDNDELLALAQHEIEQGQLENALRKLKQIIKHESASAASLAIAAKLYARLGLFRHAKELYQRHLAIQPDSLEIAFELGMVNFDLGEVDVALSAWEKLLAVNPTFPPALFYAALALSRGNRLADAKRNLDVLLQTAAADNLYFARSKELLQAIDTQAVQQSANQPPLINQR
jgi:tetratricopeptide (TPR) repeat protein